MKLLLLAIELSGFSPEELRLVLALKGSVCF